MRGGAYMCRFLLLLHISKGYSSFENILLLPYHHGLTDA